MRKTTLRVGAAVLIALSGAVPGRAADALPVPALLGTWQDRQGHLLPPGVSPFEAVRSGIVFAPDGQFTLTVHKAAGTLRQTGSYRVKGQALTLSFPFSTVAYDFSCHGDTLTLRSPGAASEVPITLRQMPAH